MLGIKNQLSVLAVCITVLGTWFVANRAQAVIVPSASDDSLWDDGLVLGGTSHFEGGGGYIYEATADSDGNQFAAIGVQDGFGFAGWAHHTDVNAVQAALGAPLAVGNVLRMSAWVMSNPDLPFFNPAVGANHENGFGFEFLNTALGDGSPGSPDLIYATPLLPVGGQPFLTSRWKQISFSYTLDNLDMPSIGAIQEVRTVMVQAGGTGANGEIFVDNLALEIFADSSTAYETGLPNNGPCLAGFDTIGCMPDPPPPDLRGDINGDGYVGIDDLNIILGQWNFQAPPPVTGPLLSDFSNFNLTDTYVDWNTGTLTSGPTDYRVEATNSGGGWFELPATLDATGMTALQVQLDVNPGNLTEEFKVVLVDADGTERVYLYTDLLVGDSQTFTVNLADFLQDNAIGAAPGLDVSNLVTFHIQGTFDDADALDITFDNLQLLLSTTVVPGDIDNDGFIGIADLNNVLSTWNNGTAPTSQTSIPEPGTALLALGGVISLVLRRS